MTSTDPTQLVRRAVAGDTSARVEIDLALDAAVAARDSATIDDYLQPLASVAAAGSTDALGLLLGYVDNHGLVRSVVRRVIADRTLAEDAAQDALWSVARSIDRFEGRSRFTTWLHPIAQNSARMILRRESRRPPLASAPPSSEVDPGLRRMSSLVVDAARVRQAIAGLPEIYRRPIELREFEDLSYAEIAEVLGVEVGTVRSRISRGRRQLAQELDLP